MKIRIRNSVIFGMITLSETDVHFPVFKISIDPQPCLQGITVTTVSSDRRIQRRGGITKTGMPV